MTRKRAKKLLMSQGFTRDFSEVLLTTKRPGVRNERMLCISESYIRRIKKMITSEFKPGGMFALIGKNGKSFAHIKIP